MEITAPASDWSPVLRAARSHASGLGVDEVRVGPGIVTSSAGESLMTLSLPAEVSGEHQPGYLPADALYKTAKGLASEDSEMTVRLNGKAEVRSEGSFEAEMNLEAQAEAFERPTVDGATQSVTLQGDVLHTLLDRVRYAAPGEAFRQNMMGVRFNLKDGEVVATDGHVLSMVHLPGKRDFDTILPLSLADLLAKNAPENGEIELMLSEAAVLASWNGGLIRGPRMEIDYPNYRAALPSEPKGKAVVGRAGLRRALQLARTYGPEGEFARASLEIRSGRLVVRAENDDRRTAATERVECREAEAFPSVTLNPSFLAEAISKMETNCVRIEGYGPLQPVVVRPHYEEEPAWMHKAIIMPIDD